MATFLPDDLHLESLEIGGTPVVRHFLQRLDLPALLRRHLPALPGRAPTVPSATLLCLLIANLLLARQPLYALAEWAARRVPAFLGLLPEHCAGLNDDRVGRALDHLQRADRASLLTALVLQVVREFHIDLEQFHQDTTTVTFSGQYAGQRPATQSERPPRITFGYNKDHRPDLKQLLYSITISADGAVPIHCKIYDGNTSDDAVHLDTWLFLKQIVGHADFLYVADSKLCTRDNMSFIAGERGRFLTVMPRTRGEDGSFRQQLQTGLSGWLEVHREANRRRREGPEVVYHGLESTQRSSEGYRVLWYRSSQKQEQDRQSRATRMERARTQVAGLRGVGRRWGFGTAAEARVAGERVVQAEQVERWLRVLVEEVTEESYRQIGPGRPGTATEYRRVETRRYRVQVEEDGEALRQEGLCDGIFPLMTNDEELSLREALGKYKYQPFVEKRHEQLKNVFAVVPMFLKNVGRIDSLLWLYHVVEIVGALVEREVRQRMEARGLASIALYPEGRPSTAPTTGLVWSVLEGHRRHRLLNEAGEELRIFHDELSAAAQEVLELLGVDAAAYGIN
jgi:transposase